MRITAAAMSYISLPPVKGDIFRRGPSQNREKKKSRLLTRALSAPIRRMSKQLLRGTSKKIFKKDRTKSSSEVGVFRDEEQGWIAPATTFETEDTLSPKSFDSLTLSDCTPILVQTEEKVEGEISNSSVVDKSQQDDPNLFWDLEAAVNESAKQNNIFRMKKDIENISHKVEYDGYLLESNENKNAAPLIQVNVEKNTRERVMKEDKNDFPSIQPSATFEQVLTTFDETLSVETEDKRHSMVSLLSKIDTTEIIDENNEIGSLVPVADISFFLDEEGCEDFHCVGRISTQPNDKPPVEIDVDRDSLDDDTASSGLENKNQELYIDDDDDISSTSSYNSYLQAIECITASANSEVEQAVATVLNKRQAETESKEKRQRIVEQAMEFVFDDVEIKTPTYNKKLEVEVQQPQEFVEEEDCVSVSFNPSKDLLLSAMKGASAKAKIDIEQATALALSKIDAVNSTAPKRRAFNLAYAQNRVLGFFCFLFFLFNLNGSSIQLLNAGTKFFSHTKIMKKLQIQTHDNIDVNIRPGLPMWVDKQLAVNAYNNTQIIVKNELIHNIGCEFKIGCLALGNI